MKMNLKWKIGLASALALSFASAGASAQADQQLAGKLQEMSQTLAQVAQSGGTGGGGVAFSTSVYSFNKLVTGAPYSAQIVTETVQPFADGNSISHKSTSAVWRDSQGRTRREQNINVIGPSQASGGAVQFITIDDPVAGVHYTLNPSKLTATQMVTSGAANGGSGSNLPVKVISGDSGNSVFTYSLNGSVAAAGGRGGSGGSISVASPEVSSDNVTTESLGADTMQGLSVLGTRVTRTIPEGQIGNAQPILIITDKWYSQDLQIDVKTVHSDPRTGTTTTTVTNLSRNEPNPTLFTVPAGYTVLTPSTGANKVTLKQQEPL